MTLPNISILVERQDAESLRDALNAELPEQAEARERDLMLDPTIRDIDVLRAAQAIASEHECHGVVKQLGNMIELYCHDEAQNLPRSAGRKLLLLSIMGDVEPVLSGPFKDERDRVEAAQDYRRAHGDEDGLYRIDATGDVTVDTFIGNELPDHPRRCALCRCDATDERHGFAVCGYHADHGEDDPPCPTCSGDEPRPQRRVRWVSDTWINGRNATLATDERRLSPAMVARTYTVDAYDLNEKRLPELRHTRWFPNATDAERAAEGWTRDGEWKTDGERCQGCGTMIRTRADAQCEDCEVIVENIEAAQEAADERDAPAPVVDERETVVDVGDRVYDAPDGKWRTVTRIEGDQVYMADGGVMGLRECMRSEIRLPSEDLD